MRTEIARDDREVLEILASGDFSLSFDYELDTNGRITSLKNYMTRGMNYPSSAPFSLRPEIGRLSDLRTLELRDIEIHSLPAEIGQLSKLENLWIDQCGLEDLPAEIGFLSNLQVLFLRQNHLTKLPAEIGLLSNLRTLDILGNSVTQLPMELWQLLNLEELALARNDLENIPGDLWRLTNLRVLNLGRCHNVPFSAGIENLTRLEALYLWRNGLVQVPSEICSLRTLRGLWLNNNEISRIPPDIGQLVGLKRLVLWNNQLESLPGDIGDLVELEELELHENRLREIPASIGHLLNLKSLSLQDNQLLSLPVTIGLLSGLEALDLRNNLLAEIPSDIGHLPNLEEFRLDGNRLKRLPPAIGHLTHLREFGLTRNPHLLSPPPEIVARGTADVLAFLGELETQSVTRYEAKLVLVGEGGTGKSSLLRALRGQPFDLHLTTTHGIEVATYSLAHPDSADVNMTLNTWDFGGQQIYHATHQFFLTQRSVYVVVWNARLGAEQGRLNYWLDTIQALAPDAPVILVATHIDERAPDLNYQLYEDAYPQLVANLAVSNLSRVGLDDLSRALAKTAVELPLMGQPWPEKWMAVERSLLVRPEHHIDASEYTTTCSSFGIEPDIAAGTLGNYLHDLGKILYFRDDYVLSNLVVLKPNWVTKAISCVLTDEATRASRGILSHAELPRIWARDDQGNSYEPHLYPAFLRLMERFDLSYQIEADARSDHSTHSLIPQLLPHQPPTDLPTWSSTPTDGQTFLEMIYRLNFVPAGIMSWFIVRTHRYTRDLHWRDGAILGYEGHDARVELNPMLRELRLQVRGVQPHNFFSILKNTVDLILERFEGLRIERNVPCICHWQRAANLPCPRFYLYEDLVRRMNARRYTVECPESFAEVSVPTLLYGIHRSTDEQVMADIQRGQLQIQEKLAQLETLPLILDKLQQQSELIARNFTRQWNLEMARLEADCPNTFFIIPGDRGFWNPKNWVSQEYHLYLICQHPTGPHPVGKGYSLRQSEEWWLAIGPWLGRLSKFLKFAVPMGKAVGSVYDEVAVEQMQTHIGLVEEITKQLPDYASSESMKGSDVRADLAQDQDVVGPALRALYAFLKTSDPNQLWGGLHKTVTPDGNILWLCGEHREIYEAKPLVLAP